MGPSSSTASNVEALKAPNSEIETPETLNSEIQTLETLNSESGTLQTLNSEIGPPNPGIETLKTLNAEIETLETLNSEIQILETLNSEIETLETLNSEIETLETLNSESGTLQTLSSEIGPPNPGLETVKTLNAKIETLIILDESEEEETDGRDREKGSESPEEEKVEDFPYPLRPDEPDCSYYVRTGACRYGPSCKFNHPPNKMKLKARNKNSAVPDQMAAKETKWGIFSESSGQMECKYFLTPKGCQYGKECKCVHQEKNEVSVVLNFLGLPMRPGEKECAYYMRTGGCKYSTNCRYHHPDPTAVDQQDPLSRYQNDKPPQQHTLPAQMPMTSWPLQGTPNEPVAYLDAPASFVPGYYLPPHANPQWNNYQAPVNASCPTGMHMQQPSLASNMNDTNLKASEYPQRPGQPECQFFMKAGSCKFKGACKFHHPKFRLPQTPGVDLNPVGLPLRPDQSVCTYYSRHGICKYGKSCRYDHPTDSAHLASPVAVTSSQNDFRDNSIQPESEAKIENSSNSVNQESEW